MRIFFAVFFGIIAAVVALYVAGSSCVTYQAHSEAREKAEALKLDSLLLAGACKTLDAAERKEIADTLDSDLERYERLLVEAGDDYSQASLSRVGLENQFRVDGCYPAGR